MQDQIEEAARKAACLTRIEYDSEGWNKVLCYDIARSAARDRGYSLCVNMDIDPIPSNVGSSLLRWLDDERALQGLPRRHQQSYKPRIIVN